MNSALDLFNCKYLLRCWKGHIILFESSSEVGGNYTANRGFLIAIACSGMLNVQFGKFCSFSKIGHLTHYEKDNLIKTLQPVNVADLSKQSISAEESELAKEQGHDGISIMTDVRHSCRKNSFHTDHLAVGHLGHKIVAVQHITKEDYSCSQRHEPLGFDRMFANFDQAGVKVVDHAHNRNATIN